MSFVPGSISRLFTFQRSRPGAFFLVLDPSSGQTVTVFFSSFHQTLFETCPICF